MADEEETTNGRRSDDMGLKLGPLELQARGKSVIFVVLVLAAIGLLYWHDYKSDNWSRVMHEGMWAQTLILATPEKDRPRTLKKLSIDATVPKAVQKKIDAQ